MSSIFCIFVIVYNFDMDLDAMCIIYNLTKFIYCMYTLSILVCKPMELKCV